MRLNGDNKSGDHDSKPTQGKQANRTSASVTHDGKVRQGNAKAPKSPIKASNAY